MALDLHQKLPQCQEIIVTTPHPNAVHVAERTGIMAKQTNHTILGVIENMSYFTPNGTEKYYLFGQGGGEKLASSLGTDLLASIPLAAPQEYGDPSVLISEEPELKKVFYALAVKLINKFAQRQ